MGRREYDFSGHTSLGGTMKVGTIVQYETRFFSALLGTKIKGVIIEVVKRHKPFWTFVVAPFVERQLGQILENEIFEVITGLLGDRDPIVLSQAIGQTKDTIVLLKIGKMSVEEMLTHNNKRIRKAGELLRRRRENLAHNLGRE